MSGVSNQEFNWMKTPVAFRSVPESANTMAKPRPVPFLLAGNHDKAIPEAAVNKLESSLDDWMDKPDNSRCIPKDAVNPDKLEFDWMEGLDGGGIPEDAVGVDAKGQFKPHSITTLLSMLDLKKEDHSTENNL